MAVDPRTDWQTIHEPKGGEGASQSRRMASHGRVWRQTVSEGVCHRNMAKEVAGGEMGESWVGVRKTGGGRGGR